MSQISDRLSHYAEVTHFFDKVFPAYSDLPAKMADTVENSPWHREANVLVHTRMVLDQAFSALIDVEDLAMVNAVILASMFHDVGKPAAQIEKSSTDRGTYKAFHGHEAMSANLFVDFMLTYGDSPLWGDFAPSKEMIAFVAFMIQEHLPYSIGADLDQCLYTMWSLGRAAGVDRPLMAFATAIRADAFGRISDDAEGKCAATEKWLNEKIFRREADLVAGWESRSAVDVDAVDCARVVFPIGASSCGKSTMMTNMANDLRLATGGRMKTTFFGLDHARLAFFKEREPEAYKEVEHDRDTLYNVAWHYANLHSAAFSQYELPVFMHKLDELVRAGKGVLVVDNTNLSKSARRRYVSAATQKKLATVAYVFMRPLATHFNFTAKRAVDPTAILGAVPEHRIRQQYLVRRIPYLGEVDVMRFIW